MKKAIRLFSILIIGALLVGLAGCGQKKVNLRMGTGGTGGVFYPYGAGIASIAGKYTGVAISVEATGGSVENMRLLEKGDCQLGMASFPTSSKAVIGDQPFTKKIDTKVVFNMYTNPVHFIVMADSNIKTLEDLKGKRVSIGAPGSGNAEVVKAFVEEVLGWKMSDFKVANLSYTESVEAFKAGNIDAAIFDTVAPTSSITELAAWKPIRLLEVPEEVLQKASGNYGKQFVKVVIPAGMYRGVDKDVVTVGHGNYLMARSDLDEKIVYDLLKAIFDHKKDLEAVHQVAKALTPEVAAQCKGLPMHPGAEKYFKEVGAIK